MNQMEFTHFLTNNACNIVSKNPGNENSVYPTADEVFDFALKLEYTEKTTSQQGYREQDGRINGTFQSEDSGQTEKNLKMFERFGIEFNQHQGGASYFAGLVENPHRQKQRRTRPVVRSAANRCCNRTNGKDISKPYKSFTEIDTYFGIIA